MRIVHIAAEFAPIAKAGGLGEVVTGLAREQTRHGHEVSVIIPRYDSIDLSCLPKLNMETPDFKSLERGNQHANTMWEATVEECRLHLLEARHPSGYFHRGKIYGCPDDVVRFLYFSRAAAEYLRLKNELIDILHLHDWHTAILALLAKEIFHLPVRQIVLSLHTVEYQGKCAPSDLDAIGLKGKDLLTKEKLQDDAFPETINLLKGGIVYSDAIVAVSPTYAKEILTPEMGFSLDPTLRKHRSKLTGILNGLDPKLWNPEKDPFLPAHYGKESAATTILESKVKARKLLEKILRLKTRAHPWVGTICRLVSQKGPDLIELGLRETVKAGGVFLILGSAPDAHLAARFEALQREFQGNPQVHLHLSFDEELAHLIYAALDFFLMPSHYEPCGLAQMIAMRYGTIPIVRRTGGLKDTVFDFDNPKVPASQRNGFTFDAFSSEACAASLQRAFALFKNDKASIQSLIRRGTSIDFSWKKPGAEYQKLYALLLRKNVRRSS